MDGLVERLRGHDCGCGGPCGQRTPAYIRQAAARIEALEAKLAARDAEIVAWLQGQAGDHTLTSHRRAAASRIATAIERGEYKDLNPGSNNHQPEDGEST